MTEVIGIGAGPTPAWLNEIDAHATDIELAAFPAATHQQRAQRLQEHLKQIEAACYVVFRPSSVEYLSGFHSVETVPMPYVCFTDSTAVAVPTAEVGRALVSSRADETLHYLPFEDGAELLARYIRRRTGSGAKVLVELRDRTAPVRYLEALSAAGLALIDAGQHVERLRLILDEREVIHLREAAQITQRGVAAALKAAADPEATDSSVAAATYAALIAHADSESAFNVVVTTGLRAAVPHATWSGTPIDRERTTFLECSGTRHRYHAPLMRTLAVRGRLHSGKLQRLEELSRTTVEWVVAHLRPDIAACELAAEARRALGKVEDWVIFHYNFGYPVGLAHPPTWMDGAPFYLTQHNSGQIQAGMVFHIPSSFRALGAGGVGLSQTVLVRAAGVEVITPGAAELSYI